jgi:hypothetical protein
MTCSEGAAGVTPIAIAHRALSDDERARKADLEVTIERGFETFVEVGCALYEIRSARLYRDEFSNFDTYCRERWGMGRSRAQQLISAARTFAAIESDSHKPVTSVTTDDDEAQLPLPTSERQLRPLVGLPDDVAVDAWRTAVETCDSDTPTVDDVERAVAATPTPARDSGRPDKSRAGIAKRVELAREMAASGHTSSQIAPAIGITVDSFWNFRKTHGIDVPADKVMARSQSHDSNRIVNETAQALEGFAIGLRLVELDELDPELIADWVSSLKESGAQLDRFRKALAKRGNDEQQQ